MPHSPVIGILAGGRSRRMGFDKAAALLAGVPMLVHIARAATRVNDSVRIVGRASMADWPADLSVRFILDAGAEPRGPAAGILALLDACHGPALVLGCDIPLLTSATIESLWRFHCAQSPPSLATLGVRAEKGRSFAEPVFAVYTAECVPLLRSIEASHGSLQTLLDAPRVARFPITAAIAEELFNVNDPEALALAEATIIAGKSSRRPG